MRILAIRGTNIASLEAFSVDFEADPLGRAGLFAITGPTGSGKSSILDALCLALFDQTPRLQGRSVVRPGRAGEEDGDRLTVTDVRNLLRRGAVKGSAEVDFVGVDGRRYRSTWEVWRARKRVDGNLQPQSIKLVDLQTGQALGDNKKTDTLAEISARLGLDFDQFRRSALLAQGDFAAFLRANESERAGLLEAMTGTDIYGRISRKAYERAKDEGSALKSLQDQVAAVALLSADERAAAQARTAALGDALERARVTRSSAEAWVTWHEAASENTRSVGQAEAALAAAKASWTAMAELRTQLAHAQEAAPLRSVVETADDRARTALEAAQAVEQLIVQHAAAQARATEAAQAAEAAALAVTQAKAQAAAWAPRLEAAAQLDERVEALQAEHRAAADAARESSVAATAAAKAVSDLDQRLEAARGRAKAAQEWLGARTGLSPMIEDWARVSDLLDQLVDDLPQAPGQQQAARKARTAAIHAHDESATQDQQRATLEGAAKQADAAAKQAAAAAEAHPRAPVDAALAVVQQRLTGLGELLSVLERDRELAAEEATLITRLRDLDATLARCEVEKQQSADAYEQASVRLRQAQRLQRLARAQADVAVHRVDLRAGEPCPLCGSDEHPWAHRLEEASADVAAADAMVEEHQAAVAAQLKRREAALVRARAAGEERREVEPQRASRAARREALAAQRDAQVEALSLDAPPEALQAAALTAQEAAAQRQGDLTQQLQHCLRLEKAAALARDEADAARVAFEAARRSHDAARRAADAAEQHAATLERAVADLDQRITQARGRLEAPLDGLPGWQDALTADPVAFRARLARDRSTWQQHQETCAATERDLASGAQERSGLKATADAASRQQEERAAAAEQRAARLESARAERAALFESTPYAGQPTAAARAAMAAAVERVERRHAAESTAASAAAARAAGVAGQLQTATEGHAAATRRATQSTEARDTALAAAGLDLPTVLARLSRGPAWLEEREAAVGEARTAVDQAEVVRAERVSRQQAHASTLPEPLVALGPPLVEEAVDPDPSADPTPPSEPSPEPEPDPSPDADTARAALQAARERIESLTQQRADTRARLTDDDRKRGQTAALRDDIEAQQAVVDHWRVLEQLIGSSDGARFRKFAQSLTLDALLIEANGHLDTLAPRYRVQRIPDHDLEIQLIDHYMADEVRGVHSLSGGESFLVSLALALGLSSLSAQNTTVETLFIDEGFGTLDPDALGVALSTLEQLQSEGRHVGLISHVPGLAQSMGAQVSVEPQGNGRSRVRVLGPQDALSG